nr:H516 [uncultured bacterium]
MAELVIGLVSALGTDLNWVYSALETELKAVGHEPKEIRLSAALRDLPPYTDLPQAPADQYYRTHIAAGDDLCARTKMRHAMAALGVMAISRERKTLVGDNLDKLPDAAYIIRSLKRPEEIRMLRSVYGDRFLVMAIYEPKQKRLNTLSDRIAGSTHETVSAVSRGKAEALIEIDESESATGIEAGQNVRDTFHRADLFIDASTHAHATSSVKRAIELIFGHPSHTPTMDEYGMFLAFGAAKRSADLSRQVGAAIMDKRGRILSLGSNEVPKAGGGAYWTNDPGDMRDFQLGHDTSYFRRTQLLGDVLRRLQDQDWLSTERRETSIEDLVNDALYGEKSTLRDAQLMDVIEFGRTVHAEMLAITEAASRGIAIEGATLYSTTFPCHNCARHIVSTGMERVVYVEPYPKSLAEDLFKDSVVLDPESHGDERVRFEPFVGIGPELYLDAFTAPERKTAKGETLRWVAADAQPKIVKTSPTYPTAEDITRTNFELALTEAGIYSSEGERDDEQ